MNKEFKDLTLEDLFFKVDDGHYDSSLAWEEILRRNGFTVEEFNELSNVRQEHLEDGWREEAYEVVCKKIVEQAEIELRHTEFAELYGGGGFYIETANSMIKNCEDYPSEDIDYTQYPYWVTNDYGQPPEGYNTVKEAVESLRERGCI